MSVVWYNDIDLSTLAAWWSTKLPDHALVINPAGLARMLGLCNRLAYVVSYDDCREFPIPQINPHAEAVLPVVPNWGIADWTEDLLYNCVSNGGANFAPTKYAQLARELAKLAEDARMAALRSTR